MEEGLPGKSAVLFIHSCDVCELRATGVVNGPFVTRVHHVGRQSPRCAHKCCDCSVCLGFYGYLGCDAVVDKQQGLLMDVRL